MISFNTEDGIGRATTYNASYDRFAKNKEFQYRRRYREGYNTTVSCSYRFTSLFQYRRRYREGYNSSNPMSSQLRIGCFNTEDGIGRATTRVRSRKMAQTSEFQYRRRYREGYNI